MIAPSPASIAAFVATTAVLFLLPGPSAFFAMGRALDLGRRRALIGVLGNALGVLPAVALVSVGIGAAVTRIPILLLAIRLAGAAFLILLGVDTVRHGVVGAPRAAGRSDATRLLVNGFVVGITNPKAIVILLAILPQYVDPHRAVPPQLAFLGLLSILLGGTADAGWSLLAGSVRRAFAPSKRAMTVLTRSGGVVLMAVGGVLGIEAVVE